MRRVHSAAFTLLELVVVLAILSIVTALAMRSLSGVEDQRRYEASQRGLQDLSDAVVGSQDDRAPDGSRTVKGFVADMGRLPVTMAVSVPTGGTELALAELWTPPEQWASPVANAHYDVRRADSANGVTGNDIDEDVFVAGGWRGPYLRPSPSASDLQDGWGNSLSSPNGSTTADPLAAGYPRLRDANDAGINTPGQTVFVVRELGANGTLNAADMGADRDFAIAFDGRAQGPAYTATVKTSVNVVAHDGTPDGDDRTSKVLIVRVFGPSSANASQVGVADSSSVALPLTTTAVAVPDTTTGITGVTIGPRAVRAYLYQTDGATPPTLTLLAKSNVKYVTLVSGVNFVALTIYRPVSTP